MTPRRLAVVLTALATASLLAACNPTSSTTDGSASATASATPTPTPSQESTAAESSEPAEDGSLTVGLTYVPDVQFAPFYVAQSAGYYEEAGLEVELRHHGASEALFGAIEDGTEDIVVASGDEVLAQRAQGSTLTQVATLFESSPVALITPQESDISSITDLTGQAIGVPGEYGSTYLGLLMLLQEAGMTTEDITVQSIGYTQTSALLTGQLPAVMGFVNGDAIRIDEGTLPVSTIMPEGLVGPGIATMDETLESDAEAIEAFLTATFRGVADVIADPAGAVETSSEYIPGMTAQAKEEALAVLEATIPLLSATGDNDPQTWQAMGEAMVAAGLIEAIPAGAYTE